MQPRHTKRTAGQTTAKVAAGATLRAHRDHLAGAGQHASWLCAESAVGACLHELHHDERSSSYSLSLGRSWPRQASCAASGVQIEAMPQILELAGSGVLQPHPHQMAGRLAKVPTDLGQRYVSHPHALAICTHSSPS
jgi:hypothetical protein